MFATVGANRTANMTLINHVFGNGRVAVHEAPNPGRQAGAILAVAEGFKQGWFEEYDWVVRVNPDVLILNDTFIMAAMNDASIDGIFADCLDVPCPGGRRCRGRRIHTDFFAVRPRAVPVAKMLALNDTYAEILATKAFSSIIEDGKDAWLPDTGPHRGACRIRGVRTSVVHDHRNLPSICE